MQLFNVVANVWLEPRHLRRTTAALIDKTMRICANALGNKAACFGELPFILAVVCHAHGNAVGGEN